MIEPTDNSTAHQKENTTQGHNSKLLERHQQTITSCHINANV